MVSRRRAEKYWAQDRLNLSYLGALFFILRVLVLQLVLDPSKDPRLLSPPVVQWQRGET